MKWLDDEKEYFATHSHYAIARREIGNELARGCMIEHLLAQDSYSGHKYGGVYIKSQRVRVVIHGPEGDSEKSFSLPRLISEFKKERVQQPLFAIT